MPDLQCCDPQAELSHWPSKQPCALVKSRSLITPAMWTRARRMLFLGLRQTVSSDDLMHPVTLWSLTHGVITCTS
jgi:hypothetical protein